MAWRSTRGICWGKLLSCLSIGGDVLCRPLGSGGAGRWPRLHERELKIEVVSIRARGAAQSCEFSYFYGFKAPALRVLAHVRH